MKISGNTPITQASEAWIEDRRATNKIRSDGTQRTYEKHVKSAVRALGDITLDEWGRDQTDAFARSLLHLHPNTRHAKLNTLKVFFDWVLRQEGMDGAVHPFGHLEAVSKVDAVHHIPVSDDALNRTLRTAPPKAKLMILLGAHIGLRRFEIAKVKRSDFDLTRMTLRLRGKGDKAATLPITDAIAEAVEQNVRWHKVGPTGYMFESNRSKGKPIGPLSVYTRITDAFYRATGEHVTPHQLRSFAATTVAKKHGILAAQTLLRHASATTTADYVDIGHEDIRAQVEDSMSAFST